MISEHRILESMPLRTHQGQPKWRHKATRSVMGTNIALLYLQGLWLEDKDLEASVYRQHLHPWLAQKIDHHPALRQLLRAFRRWYPWVILVAVSNRFTFVHPVDIAHGWDNKMAVVDNAYPFMASLLTWIGIATIVFQKDKYSSFIYTLDGFSNKTFLNTKNKIHAHEKMRNVCEIITAFFHFILWPVFVLCTLLYGSLIAYPKRKFYFRGWYPYDYESSPAYELTLIAETLMYVSGFFSINSVVATTCCMFINIIVNFEILCDNLRDVTTLSRTRIKARRARERAEHRVARLSRIERCLGSRQELASLQPLSCTGLPVTSPRNPRPTRVAPSTRGYVKRKKTTCKVVTYSDEGYSHAELDVELKLQLTKLVEFHTILLRLTKDMSSMLNILFMNLFVMNIVVYGLTMVLVTSVSEFTVKEVVVMMVSLEIVTLFILYCLMADLITTKAADVGEVLYACDWLEASPSFKQSMLIIMSRCNRPLVIKPSGVNPYSLKLFREVANKAYKFVATMGSFVN